MLACGLRARGALVSLCAALAAAHTDCELALAESSSHAQEREASGAAPGEPPPQGQAPPIGNQSTAKWRVFTDMSRDFVKQVCTAVSGLPPLRRLTCQHCGSGQVGRRRALLASCPGGGPHRVQCRRPPRRSCAEQPGGAVQACVLRWPCALGMTIDRHCCRCVHQPGSATSMAKLCRCSMRP